VAKLTIPKEEYFMSGHIACLGCGSTLAMRYLLKGLGPRTIVSVPACCWAIMHGVFPNTCLKVPIIDTAFEVTGASIAGVRAALDAKGIKDVNVVGFAGDGGTADIGIQALSGTVERNQDIFYVMYDNEAYMNTGIQRSSATPMGAWTTTTPVGKMKDWKAQPKKDMVEIMVAHRIPYTCTCSVAYPEDMLKKVKKAKGIKGSKFIHVHCPCPPGWRYQPEKTIEIARLAVETKAFPLYEVENGVYKITKKPKGTPIVDYLRLQNRFRHLPEDIVAQIQRDIDWEWERLLLKEKMSKESSSPSPE
jgi:pyruvate/2-oxoacid:ferredoxin oxidoreductase beta subunit